MYLPWNGGVPRQHFEWLKSTIQVKARVQALHLLTSAEGDTTLIRQRQQTIVHNYQHFESIIDKVEHQLNQRIRDISALVEQSNTTNANKVLLRKWTTTTLIKQKITIEEVHL